MLLSYHQEAVQWTKLAYNQSYTPFVKMICKSSIQVIVVHQKTQTVLAFAYTITKKPLTNTMKKFMDGMVDGGLLALYQTIEDDIKNELHKPNVQRNILICGHSFGGAIACLCAMDLSWNYNVDCITFACPCFVSLRFQKIFRNILPSAVSYCNLFDVYAHIPFTYKQAGMVKWIVHPCCSPRALACFHVKEPTKQNRTDAYSRF